MGLFGTRSVDVLTMGRIGVDIYPHQHGVGLEDVTSFGKFLGGSATNVAVAAARLRRSAAVVTAVGDDPFGRFCRAEMGHLGVFDDYVKVDGDLNTPVTFCEIFPPDNFPLYFYRRPTAPDLRLRPEDLPIDAIVQAKVFWVTATGLSREPSRSTHLAALKARGRRPFTILDLDYRAQFWPSPEAAREAIAEVLPYVDIVVGNSAECEVAVGESDPERAAEALMARGVDVAVVKRGPDGVLAMDADRVIEVAGTPIEVVNGLGAGDAFGGALCFGLIKEWPLVDTLVAASAAGALVATRLECSTAMPSEPELLAAVRRNPVDTKTRHRVKENS
ncbi:MAG TPA: 5-dehydro-2-deoxygluconokinase [Arachnia sp.]|nr:5-dehydro-2-deoxygluconokinase [Arachnia sp.]